MRNFILTGIILSLAFQSGYSQLDNLLRKTSRKLSDRIEQMAVEKLSDIIAQKAAEKVEKSFDAWLQEAIEQDTSYNPDDSTYYRAGAAYAQFLKGMNDAADLPPEYTFDLNMLTGIKSEGEDPETVRMFYSTQSAVFAMQTATSEKRTQIILIDAENDATVMYTHEGDKKTAQALPNFMKLAGSMAGQSAEEQLSYTVTPLNKRTKVAGYKCDGYELTNDEYRMETWLTDELGVDWRRHYGVLMEKFAPGEYDGAFEELDGLALRSEQFSAENGKLITSIEALEVNREETVITNADYTFGYQQD